jgi:spermidine/putrescine transport system substrate-binding protein
MNRPLPEDPMVRQLIKAAKNTKVSRRGFLAGTGGAATTAALATAGGASTLALAGCAPSDSLVWVNWELYLDQDDEGNYPSLERFQEESGINVTYRTDIDDNNTWFATVRDQLELGQYIDADIVTPTEWMAARFVNKGYALKLNEANIPNKANLAPALANPGHDPGRQYTLPWQGGFAGLCWNNERVDGELRTLDDLFDKAEKGKIVVLSEMRDTMGVFMMAQGTDITKFTADEFYTALEELERRVQDGYIRNFLGNAYKEELVNGDIHALIGWSGDMTQLNFEQETERFQFAFPESGATLWNDTMLIPIESPRQAEAEALMNYYYDPAVAAEVAAWVNYVTPVVGAKEAAIEIDPELAENELIFPSEETLAKTQAFRSLTDEEDAEFQAAFQELITG